MAVRIFHDNSQQYYFKYSYTRRTFYYSVDIITYWFYLLHKFKVCSTFTGKFRNNCSVNRNFPEHYSITFRNSRTTSRKFPVYGKKIVPEIVPEFRFSGTFSIMEMEKISGSFPYVNRNPELRWKPYITISFKPLSDQ